MNLRDAPLPSAHPDAMAAVVTELAAAAALPRLEAPAARALSRLYRQHEALRLPLDAPRNALLQWRWLQRNDDGSSRWARYRFRLGPHTGQLALSELAEAMLLAERQPQRLPFELRCVLLADALSAIVDKIETTTRQRFEWMLPEAGSDATAAIDEARAAGFELAQDDAPQRWAAGAVQMDDASALDALCAAWPLPASLGPWPQALLLPLSFELGCTPLSLLELRGIARGDIVAIEQWRSYGEAIEATLVIGHRQRSSLRARADGSAMTLMPWKEFSMTNSIADRTEGLAAEPSSPSLERLDGMEVMLRFEVGELQLPLRELRSLQPGHVFELGQPLNRSTVRIVAHGNLLGHGHLVAVGDRLGVRVAEFAPDIHG